MKLSTASIVLASVIGSACFTYLTREVFDKNAYEKGYSDCTSYFRQTLLDENYAEYDKKTAEWKLLDATTIQGNLILPSKRILYTTLDEQIQGFEDELRLLKKQKEAVSKRQPQSKTTKLDMKKL